MCRVLCLGDSLTSGWGVAPNEAMPVILEKLAAEAGKKIKTTNAGVPGDTTFGAAHRLPSYLDNDYDVVIVWLGTNDLMQGYSAMEIADEAAVICKGIREAYSKAPILLCNVDYPMSFSPEQLELSERYTELAKEEGYTLVKCPLYEVVGQPQYVQPDGLHPNAAGTYKGAEVIWAHLKEHIVKAD